VRLNPRDSDSYTNYALCHARLSEHEAALSAARRAVEIDPHDAELHSNLIALMNYTMGADPATMLGESRNWDERHAAPAEPILFCLTQIRLIRIVRCALAISRRIFGTIPSPISSQPVFGRS